MAIKNLKHAQAVQRRRENGHKWGLAAAVRRWCRKERINYGVIAPEWLTKYRSD